MRGKETPSPNYYIEKKKIINKCFPRVYRQHDHAPKDIKAQEFYYRGIVVYITCRIIKLWFIWYTLLKN